MSLHSRNEGEKSLVIARRDPSCFQSQNSSQADAQKEKTSGAVVGFHRVDLLRSEVIRSSAARKMLKLGSHMRLPKQD